MNTLYFANLVGLRDKTAKTENWVAEMLTSKEYLKGSRYYEPPEAFLYFLSRTTAKFPYLATRIGENLKEELKKRIDQTGYPVDLAMRITTARNLGIENPSDRSNLLKLLREDGSFPADSFFKYGDKKIFFGSRAISTSFAVEALAAPT